MSTAFKRIVSCAIDLMPSSKLRLHTATKTKRELIKWTQRDVHKTKHLEWEGEPRKNGRDGEERALSSELLGLNSNYFCVYKVGAHAVFVSSTVPSPCTLEKRIVLIWIIFNVYLMHVPVSFLDQTITRKEQKNNNTSKTITFYSKKICFGLLRTLLAYFWWCMYAVYVCNPKSKKGLSNVSETFDWQRRIVALLSRKRFYDFSETLKCST